MSLRRRLMMAAQGGGLPAPFRKLSFLQGDTHAYIQTLYKFNDTDEITSVCRVDSINVSDEAVICSKTWRTGDNRSAFPGMYHETVGIYWSWYGSEGARGILKRFAPELGEGIVGNFFELTYQNGIFSFAGSIADCSGDRPLESADVLCFPYGYRGACRHTVRTFSHTKNGALVADMTAALCPAGKTYTDGNTGATVTAATDKPGMYDAVTGRFFVNQGTGEFLYA